MDMSAQQGCSGISGFSCSGFQRILFPFFNFRENFIFAGNLVIVEKIHIKKLKDSYS